MASPEILDFAKLLAAIPGSTPAGINLRANRSPTAPYDQLKDARTAARNAERELLVPIDKDQEIRNKKVVNEKWPFIRQLAPTIIAEQAKDLELTAWLIESLVRQRNGYAGLRDGFRLARQLIETYWEGLYPLPDEDGVTTRVAPLAGLNGEEAEGTLLMPIRCVPITEADGDQPITCLSFQLAAELQSLDDATRKRRIEQGAVPMQVIDAAVASSSKEYYVNLVDDLQACLDEYDNLNMLLQDKCGADAPPSSSIRGVIEGCLDTVRNLAKDKLAVPVAEGAEAAGEAGGAAGAAGATATVAVGAIRTREDAFRTLMQVAEYFRRNEPHTPVSYALEQAVRWGKMPLPELLAELIPEDSVRSNLFKLVGIKPPSPN